MSVSTEFPGSREIDQIEVRPLRRFRDTEVEKNNRMRRECEEEAEDAEDERRRGRKERGEKIRKVRESHGGVRRPRSIRTSPRVPMGRLAHPWVFQDAAQAPKAFRGDRNRGKKRIESFVARDSGGPPTWQI